LIQKGNMMSIRGIFLIQFQIFDYAKITHQVLKNPFAQRDDLNLFVSNATIAESSD